MSQQNFVSYDDATSIVTEVASKIAEKQDVLSFDNSPTQNSDNPVKSGGVYTALASKANTSDIGTAAAKNFTTSVTSGSNDLVTSGAVHTAIDNLPEPMVFKGSLGTGGTITALPVNGTATVGDTYKVITAGTYASKEAKVGDTFICLTKTSSANTWELIPSGDEPSGTVTSVTLKATSPIVIDSSSAITSSGTRTLSHANSGATAGSYGDSGNQTPGYGSTFKVPYVTVNATGHVTAISEHTVKIPASDNTNTTYTFANGTNGFTVTPSGGSAQTVTVTPSFSVGTGDSNGQVKINGTNASVKGLGSAAYTASTAYVASTNGTHTGALKLYREGTTDNNYPSGITFSNKNTTTGNTSTGYINAYNGGASGTNMVIAPCGNMFIGSGEAPSNHFNAGFAQSTSEVLYIDSDNAIHLQANAQTIANRVGAQIDTSGNIIPEKADVATNNIGGIGTSSYKWANGYFTNINGVAVGSSPKFTDTTYTAATAAPGAIAASGSAGSSTNYARQDHTHGITVATGDSNGQVKIAGQNASVKGLGSAAYTSNDNIVYKNTDIPEGSANLSATATTHKITTYRNGITIPYQMDNTNDGGIIRCRGTSESNCIFEIGTWDDSGAGETIQFNYYPTTSQVTPTYSVAVPKKSGTIALTSDVTNATDPIFYGTCSTAANTAAKVVTASKFSGLATGVTVKVKFSNNNSADNPTLNVNSTGAKTIWKSGGIIKGSNPGWMANEVVSFTYDGTRWIMDDILSSGRLHTQGYNNNCDTYYMTCSVSGRSASLGGLLNITQASQDIFTIGGPSAYVIEAPAQGILINQSTKTIYPIIGIDNLFSSASGTIPVGQYTVLCNFRVTYTYSDFA